MEDVLQVVKKEGEEILWNRDLIDLIRKELESEFSNYHVKHDKVLKDIHMIQTPKYGYELQFGLVDQDIVIYKDTMDASKLLNTDGIYFHNKGDNPNEIIIPNAIIELKFKGVNSHGLITYSKYAQEIKSIFPDCRYMMAIRYDQNSSRQHYARHGQGFDGFFSFGQEYDTSRYYTGKFGEELKQNEPLSKRWAVFINHLKSVLLSSKFDNLKW